MPATYRGQRRKPKKSSIFGLLEKLLDLDGLYRLYELECSSCGDCRRLQVNNRSNETRDGEDSAENYGGSCDEDLSDDEEDIRSDDGGGSDYVEEEEEEEEEHDKGHGDDEEEEEEDDDDVGDGGDDDGRDNDGRDDYDANDRSRKRYQLIENVHKCWRRHKWPKEKDRILEFARIALRLDSATTIAYEVKESSVVGRSEELPVSLMTPVREFGKSFLLVERTEKRSSLFSESLDNQSYVNSDTERTLVGFGNKGRDLSAKGLIGGSFGGFSGRFPGGSFGGSTKSSSPPFVKNVAST